MGGKNKHRGKHNHRANNQNNHQQQYAPRMSEDDLCQLVAEATEIHGLLNSRHQQLKKVQEFAYLLSTKWLRQWKDYVGYDDLMNDQSSKGKKKMGRKRPGPPNKDIAGSNREYFTVPQEQMAQYAYLNQVLAEKMSQPEDYISVTPALWEKFNTIYGPGQQLKRPTRKLKSGKMFVDGALMKTDMFFIDYGQPQLLEKLCHVKSSKDKLLDDLLPENSMQMSTIWDIEQLYIFLEDYCEINYGCKKITIWQCENFMGVKSLQEQFAKSVKDKSYKVNAYELKIGDQRISDLDLDDFLKTQYTLIVEIGDSKIVTAELPDEIFGYCEECVEKKKLSYSCECNRIHYCSRECQSDDQVWHYNSCKEAFDSEDDDQFRKKKGIKTSRCGLKNLGNTCYMNSSVQLFIELRFITEFLCNNKAQKISNKEDESSKMLIQKIGKTCKMMGETKNFEYIAPWSFKSQINYFLPAFKGYKQHDAIDFLTGLLNTLNQSLDKPKEEAYSTLFKENIMGKFNSLVICPGCDNKVQNEEDFLQITLPIKPKTNKLLFTYVKFQTPLLCSYGRAEAFSDPKNIFDAIGVEQQCLVLSGREGEEDLDEVDLQEEPEKKIKKLKKDVLFFANEKINRQKQIWISSSFIVMKNVCGQQMKVVSGYPFPLIMESDKTVGHIFIQILRKFVVQPEIGAKIDEIEVLYSKNNEIRTERLQKVTKQHSNRQMKRLQEESKKQETEATNVEKQEGEQKGLEEWLKQNLDEIEMEINELMKSCNDKMKAIIQQDFKMKLYIEDRNRIKNVCFFCKKKCSGCLLNPMFEENLSEFFAHKLKDSKLNIYFDSKPELQRQKIDIADNGDSTLQDCLVLFGEPEQLDEQNAWWCEKCEDLQLAYKQMHVKHFPRYLLIQLNRFKNGANGKVKNNEPIQYREYETFGNDKYRLTAAIIHEGSIEGGHYWAIGLRDNQYFQFNDDRVTKTQKICNKGAYILCYRREEH